MPFGRAPDPRVPPQVEAHLVGLSVAAAQAGGARSGRGAAAAARLLRTAVDERAGVANGTRDDVLGRVRAAVGAATPMAGGPDLVRLALPVDRFSGVVVDLRFPAPQDATVPSEDIERDGVPVVLRVYGKVGLLDRRPTAAVAERVWAAVLGASGHDAPGQDAPGAGGAGPDRPKATPADATPDEGIATGAVAAFIAAIGPVIASVHQDWATLWIRAEIDAESAAYQTYYLSREAPPHVHPLYPPMVAHDQFHRLWTAARQAAAPWPWTSATLVVTRGRDGDPSFTLDFGYDPVPIERESERARDWKQSYLPAGVERVPYRPGSA